ncbi:hypothetical protein [Massilia suwonensis]|uniref:Uncharacterized protein n=1 Tax=Massilia suwonensis TaxID=648895 RepID=A0ABW0MRP8_9BURK
MHQKSRAALIGALLAVPLGALAQQSPRTPDPADPAAPVTPIVYESVITPPAPQGGAPTPDKLWRAANEAVAPASSQAAHQAAPARQPAPVDHGAHHQAGKPR